MTVSNSIQMTERASAPDTPATNAWRVYFKSGGLYVVDDAGTETGPLGTGGGSSSPTTTDGDLIVRGASADERLAIGTAGQVLTVVGGVPTWAAASGGGDLVELVANTVLGSAAASISLTSIPGSYAHLRLVLRLRSDRSAADDGLNMTFNSDTGSNYAHTATWIVQNSAAAATFDTTDSGLKWVFVTSAGTSLAGFYSPVVIDILNYAATGYHRQLVGIASLVRASADTGLINHIHGHWTNTANAITQIDIAPLAGSNFIAGSSYSLYGIG